MAWPPRYLKTLFTKQSAPEIRLPVMLVGIANDLTYRRKIKRAISLLKPIKFPTSIW